MNILFPGSFNPFHEGHQYVVDKVNDLLSYTSFQIVSFINPNKDYPVCNSTIPLYKGTIDQYCKEYNIDLIVRGLRTYKDVEEDTEWLDYLLQNTECTIIYIKCPKNLEVISSTSIRNS